MEKIAGVNVKKIVWTSFVVSKGNDLSCVLVKKNLFKGYTIIKSNGEKEKVDNLDYLNEFDIMSESHQLIYQKESFKNINQAFQNKNNAHREDVARLKFDLKEFDSEYKKLEDQMNEQKKQYERNISDFNYSRVKNLKKGFSRFGEWKYQESGYKAVSKPVTSWQKEHGITCNIVEEYYNESNSFEWDMKSYLETLINELDGEYKDAAKSLSKYYNLFSSQISKLDCKFNEELYNNVFAMKMEFINLFKEFIILWRTNKKDSDVSYYNSGNNYSAGDEKSTVIRSSSFMISQGQEACANLISIMLGEEAKNKFLCQIDSLIKTQETPELNDENKKSSSK